MLLSSVVLAFVLSAAFARPDDWDLSRKLLDTGQSGVPNICSNAEYVHLAYLDSPSEGNGRSGFVMHKKSGDGGRTWSKPARLSGLEEMKFWERSGIRVACWENEVHVAWVSNRWVGDSGGFVSVASIVYRNSGDNGETWSDPIDLDTKYPLMISGFDVLVSDQLVVVAWNSFSFEDYDYCNYVVSSNRGQGWTGQEKLHPQIRSLRIDVLVDGGTIYAFTNYPEVDSGLDWGNATVSIGTDQGREWTAISLRDYFGFEKLYLSGLATSNGKLLAASDKGLMVSENKGLDWAVLETTMIGGPLEVGDSTIVAWGSQGRSFNVSTDAGESWTEVLRPDTEGMFRMDSEVYGSNITFLLVPYHSQEGPEVRMFTSEDLGQTWEGPFEITDHHDTSLLILFSVSVGLLLSATVVIIALLLSGRISSLRKQRGTSDP